MARAKAVLVRMDKLGDLVLSLPVDQSPALASFEVHWLVSAGTGFIATHASPSRIRFEAQKEFSVTELRRVVRWLKSINPEVAIVLYAPWWIGLALTLAGIKTRVGRQSQWHSFLFFNQGIRQSRRHGDQHETDLNLELVEKGLGAPPSPHSLFPLRLEAPPITFSALGLSPLNYLVVHPGMAGSALNWPTGHYNELIRYLVQRLPVVVTGTRSDQPNLAPLKTQLGELPAVHWLDDQLNSSDLLGVLAGARAVIAPSTGVLHLAAALGTPAVGLYSPIAVQRPTRWGARGLRVRNLQSPASLEDALAQPEAAMARLTPIAVIAALQDMGVALQ